MSKAETIRWGLSGTGTIARRFAADIQHAHGARLTGIAGRSAEKTEAIARVHHDVESFSSLDAMLASGSVDAVYVATSNTVHLEQMLACISNGIPVIVEKPLTASLSEAQQIRAAAKASGCFVMEAMWTRYLPAVRAARAAIRDGAIGRIKRLEAELSWKVAYDPSHRLFDAAQGGGALHDLGVYPLSLARFFLGEPEAVEGHWRAAPSGVDISAQVTMRYTDADAIISCGFDRDGANQLVIAGEDGALVLGPLFINAGSYAVCGSRRLANLTVPGGNGLYARARRKLFRHLPTPGVKWHAHGFAGTGLQFEIEAASDAIRAGLGEEPENTLDDTISVLQMIDAVLVRQPRTR